MRSPGCPVSDRAAQATPEAADEPFIERFRALMPAEVARSFDEAQLRAIVGAFGHRRWQRHGVDARFTIPLFGRHFYVVLLAGRERRSRRRLAADRTAHPIATLGNLAFAVTFFGSLAVSAAVVLYLMKSVLGIDLAHNFSLGLYADLKRQVQLLFH